MNPTLLDTLIELLDATPMPPMGVDIDVLLVAFDNMHARRSGILARMAVPSSTRGVLGTLEMEIASTLETRQAVWMAQLAEAKQAVSEQRIGTTKLRAYAPSLSAR